MSKPTWGTYPKNAVLNKDNQGCTDCIRTDCSVKDSPGKYCDHSRMMPGKRYPKIRQAPEPEPEEFPDPRFFTQKNGVVEMLNERVEKYQKLIDDSSAKLALLKEIREDVLNSEKVGLGALFS